MHDGVPRHEDRSIRRPSRGTRFAPASTGRLPCRTWGEFYRDHYGEAVAIVSRSIRPSQRGRASADDFVQEAVAHLIALPSGRLDIDGDRPLFGLVVRVARWKALRDLRNRGGADHRTIEPGEDFPADPDDPGRDPDRDDMRARAIAMGSTPQLRDVIRLRLEGVPVGEIARATGRSVAATSAYLKRFERGLIPHPAFARPPADDETASHPGG